MIKSKILAMLECDTELESYLIEKSKSYENTGADEIFIYNYTLDEEERENFFGLARKIITNLDIPVIIGCYIDRFEDVKKALYTGAKSVVVDYKLLKNLEVLKEASARFSKDKLIISNIEVSFIQDIKDYSNTVYLINHEDLSKSIAHLDGFNIILEIKEIENKPNIMKEQNNVIALSSKEFDSSNLMAYKKILVSKGVNLNILESAIPFKEFKLNEDGLIPVIVQDYRTGNVLMLAYMNKESYNKTIETGVMTYYSRSREELWTKGETSGHYQYLKELKIDCDRDTILAKVSQVGVACHTGSPSCFYTNLAKKDYNKSNPLTILSEVYDTILERKNNPKKGSYTNYLFDKGIDKILKKCGEEATEIVIAAKNPNAEELRYEIADFLYHMMVLMVECDLNWKDITHELSDRK